MSIIIIIIIITIISNLLVKMLRSVRSKLCKSMKGMYTLFKKIRSLDNSYVLNDGFEAIPTRPILSEESRITRR